MRAPSLNDVQSAGKRLAIVELLHGPMIHWPSHHGYRAQKPLAMLHRDETIDALQKAGIVTITKRNEWNEQQVELTRTAEPLARECERQFKRVLEPRSKS